MIQREGLWNNDPVPEAVATLYRFSARTNFGSIFFTFLGTFFFQKLVFFFSITELGLRYYNEVWNWNHVAPLLDYLARVHWGGDILKFIYARREMNGQPLCVISVTYLLD